METDDSLTALDPAYCKVLRISAGVQALVLLLIAGFLESLPTPPGSFLIPVALLAIWLVAIAPARRFSRWGYRLDGDLLRITRGYLFYRDTVVPLGRIQHIDVQQGPVMRRYDLATLTVHTAGNLNAGVDLPGLRHDDALAMRETIRQHIKQAQP